MNIIELHIEQTRDQVEIIVLVFVNIDYRLTSRFRQNFIDMTTYSLFKSHSNDTLTDEYLFFLVFFFLL